MVTKPGSLFPPAQLAAAGRELCATLRAMLEVRHDDGVEPFEELNLTVHDIVAAGDKVVVRFTNGGRNTGPFLAAEPTGELIRWKGIGIYAVVEGRITEAWFSEDPLLGFAGQVGLIDFSGANRPH